MPKVGIVMGSDSDLKVMSKAAATLEKFGIDYEMTIISAHRMPDVFFDWAKAAEGKGIKVIIAGAGMAAHLPRMCAALFPMPVIGIPMSGKNLEGMDALYSIVQMPPGIPVATVAIDGVEPTLDNTYSGKYPVWGYEHMYTKGEATGAVKAFLDFILSADYGKEIEKQGYGVTAKMQVKR